MAHFKHNSIDNSAVIIMIVLVQYAQKLSSNKHDDLYRSLKRTLEEQVCLRDCLLRNDHGVPPGGGSTRLIVAENPLSNRDSNQLTITSLLLRQARRPGGTNTRPSSSVKQNAQSKGMIVVGDDKPAVKTTEQAGESCHDRMKRS